MREGAMPPAPPLATGLNSHVNQMETSGDYFEDMTLNWCPGLFKKLKA